MTTWDENRKARASLSAVVTPGDAKLAALVREHGPEEVWESLRSSTRDTVWTRRARQFEWDKLMEVAQCRSLRYLVPGDPGWPLGLNDLDAVKREGQGGAPLGLWCLGEGSPAEFLARAVGVVGSRASTSYGDRVSSDLGAELAVAQMTVVSGGAYGIDAAAHRGALSVQGRTVAILACGLDRWYPRGNTSLLQRVAEAGLVLAEVSPGTDPYRAGFLARNRLIAASSLGVVLVEAAHRSGALNTMNWANDLGRRTMAVPGPVHSSTSLGPHNLIVKAEAALIAGSAAVLEMLAPIQPDLVPPPGPARLLDDLEPSLLTVREALPGRGGASAGELVERTGMAHPACLAALAELELRELVRRGPDGTWRLRRPGPRHLKAQQ